MHSFNICRVPTVRTQKGPGSQDAHIHVRGTGEGSSSILSNLRKYLKSTESRNHWSADETCKYFSLVGASSAEVEDKGVKRESDQTRELKSNLVGSLSPNKVRPYC